MMYPNRRPKPGPKAGRAEEVEQARLLEWCQKPSVQKLMPALRWLHHSPNGGKRDAFTGGQMKALGVRRGFPDLILPMASYNSWKIGLAIEMKAPGGRTSPEQRAWLDMLALQGWTVDVCYSADEARAALIRYLLPPDQHDDVPELELAQ